MKKIPPFILILSLVQCAWAQQSTPGAATAVPNPPPLPSGALLKPMADNTRWTITVAPKTAEDSESGKKPRVGKGGGNAKAGKAGGSAKTAKSGGKPKPGTIIGEKMGNMMHVTRVMTDGTKEEKWSDGNLTATLSPGTGEPSFSTGTLEEAPMPSWITRANYTGVTTQDMKSCLVFHDRIIPTGVEIFRDYDDPEPDDPENSKVEATAMIDADTRLPVCVTEGESSATYKFEPLASDSQIVPPAIQAALEERGKKQQEAVSQPARP